MMVTNFIKEYLHKEKHIAPLITFRVIFGAVMLYSIIRFSVNGWIYTQYIQPSFFFSFVDWIKPLSADGMYLLFMVMGLSALGILLGAFYRISSIIFFLSFTYVELLDKTNYLNHYYFISIVGFLLIFLPAHRAISIDACRNPHIKCLKVPAWTIDIICLQLGLVYFYAGIAKLNHDWLIRAMPLKIWLPSKSHLPLIGWLFDYRWVAFAFSWFGAIYDLSIAFLLSWKRSRLWAYATVIAFHVLTAVLFQIGMFPFIMIGCTLIFFSERFHISLWKKVRQLLLLPAFTSTEQPKKSVRPSWFLSVLIFHFVMQILLPWRFMLYPGNLFWTEQGYRFSWRVMLMEKAGYVTFKVKERGKEGSMEISPSEFLTPVQEKMMSTQPDMILQFAHYLSEKMQERGVEQAEVYAKAYVGLNGRSSKKFIDENVNLASEPRSWQHKWWILPLNE
ncbi:hypothetical protein OKW21_003051 [Catalinimonas alkaloidigena]|uniref:HTTM domain-containing protein n=1 Tax=Catalinimonas alkaloidigena TaxID=1075417 RepID=UPI00240688A5|nr:HTTM domain-containing protein [Catalinimonas alkaloidigena]MDF9797788.1 hypothetical protein [Catalinimonas alkaloidigena]